MAKITYKLQVMKYMNDFTTGDFDLSIKKNMKEATWLNEETDARVVIKGEKLKEGEELDHIGGGKITDVTVYSGNKVILDVDGLNVKANKLSALFNADDDGITAVINYLAAGNDKVIGTKKSDVLFSGAGNDTLTGKGGSDTFIFHAADDDSIRKAGKKFEADVITDFDVKGKDRDYLEFDDSLDFTFKAVDKGRDTLITFDDRSTLLLEDVTRKEFKAYAQDVDLI